MSAGRDCANLPAAEDPRDLGWEPARLEAARARAREGGAAAFIVATAGRLVVADGDIAKPMLAASIRKSLLSALVGQAVAERRLALDAPISQFGLDDDAALTVIERTARVEDLLTARSGVYLPTAAETPSMRAKRPARGSHPPGSYFYYNNWDFNALGNLYERATGKSVFLAFDRRIARPLCMQDFDPHEDGWYVYNREAPRYPAYHLRLSARDLLRFGLMYLDRGRWGETQVVPAEWIAASTRAVSRTDRPSAIQGGYGYLWWISTDAPGHPLPAALVGSYTASGSGGQEMTVLPAIDTVILVRADTTPDQRGASVFRDAREWESLLRLTLAARRERD